MSRTLFLVSRKIYWLLTITIFHTYWYLWWILIDTIFCFALNFRIFINFIKVFFWGNFKANIINDGFFYLNCQFWIYWFNCLLIILVLIFIITSRIWLVDCFCRLWICVFCINRFSETIVSWVEIYKFRNYLFIFCFFFLRFFFTFNNNNGVIIFFWLNLSISVYLHDWFCTWFIINSHQLIIVVDQFLLCFFSFDLCLSQWSSLIHVMFCTCILFSFSFFIKYLLRILILWLS